MKHLMNRRSGTFLCVLKRKPTSKDYTLVGSILGGQEQMCQTCESRAHSLDKSKTTSESKENK